MSSEFLVRWPPVCVALCALAQVFRTSIRALANDVRFRTYEAPFNSDTFFWTQFTPRQGFTTGDAYRAYLRRRRNVPRYFDEQVANMRTGLARVRSPTCEPD